MTRARQVANFDPALFAADEVSGDKVSGGTIGAGTLGSGVTFPAGHVLQVVHARNNTTANTNTTTYTASGVTDNITVTSGNDILVTASIPFRMFADGSSTDWMTLRFKIYHSTDDASYNDLTGVASDYYKDQAGNLPNDQWISGTSYITYLHESVSGTSHYYKVYFNSGAQGETVYVSTSGAYWTMTLMEIQS